jgi:hypothetical protein
MAQALIFLGIVAPQLNPQLLLSRLKSAALRLLDETCWYKSLTGAAIAAGRGPPLMAFMLLQAGHRGNTRGNMILRNMIGLVLGAIVLAMVVASGMDMFDHPATSRNKPIL